MTNNKQARNATRGNADENTGGRLIDDMGFLERLEAGLVTEEERREFAMELIADDDAHAIQIVELRHIDVFACSLLHGALFGLNAVIDGCTRDFVVTQHRQERSGLFAQPVLGFGAVKCLM